jgi:hypothetical protein
MEYRPGAKSDTYLDNHHLETITRSLIFYPCFVMVNNNNITCAITSATIIQSLLPLEHAGTLSKSIVSIRRQYYVFAACCGSLLALYGPLKIDNYLHL